jgi:hypothetical protein
MDGRCSHRESISNQVILVNINTLKGKVYENGTFQDEIKVNGLLEKGKHCGLMILLVSNALKLQDPGVNLTYVKTDNYQMVQRQILQLTFNAVCNS